MESSAVRASKNDFGGTIAYLVILSLFPSRGNAQDVILDIPAIAAKSIPEVVAALGEPDSRGSIRSDGRDLPQLVFLDGDLEIAFVNGRADWITLYRAISMRKESLRLLNLPVRDPSFQRRSFAIDWRNGAVPGTREVNIFAAYVCDHYHKSVVWPDGQTTDQFGVTMTKFVRTMIAVLPLLILGPVASACGDVSGPCCRVCTVGKACGDSCIAMDKQCSAGSGCACNASASVTGPAGEMPINLSPWTGPSQDSVIVDSRPVVSNDRN